LVARGVPPARRAAFAEANLTIRAIKALAAGVRGQLLGGTGDKRPVHCEHEEAAGTAAAAVAR
jgi:hypothetical protein